MRQKVKDMSAQAHEQDHNNQKDNNRNAATERLMREIEVLRTENEILRQHVGGDVGKKGFAESVSKAVSEALDTERAIGTRRTEKGPSHEDVDAESEIIEPGRGRVLGSGDVVGDEGTALNDLRRQLHNKWEAEKRLQKRISILESRLEEKVDECQDIGDRLRRAQQIVSQQSNQLGQVREQKQRQQETRQKSGRGVSDNANIDPNHTLQLEESRQKVFELEEENERLRRLSTVQLPNEMSTLRHRCDTYQSRISQLEQELEDAEYSLKVARSELMGGSNHLRASEDRSIQIERLKEELQAARKQRLELEANLLERDSKSLELRFEVESKEAENGRLRRRLKELESATRQYQRQASVHATDRPHTTGKLANVNSNSSPESVIESLRKVIDKLKGENERLRRGIGVEDEKKKQGLTSASGVGEKEKKLLAQEKKKTSRQEEEIKNLQEKIHHLEDGGQKLVQKQQQVASLRKQLKTKDERVMEAEQRVKELKVENDQMKQRLSDGQNRLQQLEMQLATSQSATASALSSAQRHNQRQGDLDAKERELSELRRKGSEANMEIATLKAQLNETRRELRLARDTTTGPTGGDISRVTAEEQQLLRKLKAENARLKDELSAFDLDFFEEIENLKYAHSEAMKQLKWYEKKYGTMR